MPLGMLFWVLFVVALVFGLWPETGRNWRGWGASLLPYALIFLLGWATFGAVVRH